MNLTLYIWAICEIFVENCNVQGLLGFRIIADYCRLVLLLEFRKVFDLYSYVFDSFKTLQLVLRELATIVGT